MPTRLTKVYGFGTCLIDGGSLLTEDQGRFGTGLDRCAQKIGADSGLTFRR